MRSVTISKEHYLKAVYELDVDGRGARVSDVALALGVTKTSASNALAGLIREGYAKRTPHRAATLTLEGMLLAIELETRYRTALHYFEAVLGFTEADAKQAACALEHVLEDEAWLRMETALEKAPKNTETKKQSTAA